MGILLLILGLVAFWRRKVQLGQALLRAAGLVFRIKRAGDQAERKKQQQQDTNREKLKHLSEEELQAELDRRADGKTQNSDRE